MVYELTGSTCEGYTEKQRFVTRITNEDGQEITSDDRISDMGGAAGKRFRFNSTEMRDGKSAVDTVGDAVRASTADEIAVVLSKPDKKDLTLPPARVLSDPTRLHCSPRRERASHHYMRMCMMALSRRKSLSHGLNHRPDPST